MTSSVLALSSTTSSLSRAGGNTAPEEAGSGAPEQKNPLRRAIDALDRYTSPRPSTGGDLEEHDYLQSLFHAWGSGFAFMGLPGVGIASACSVAGTYVARKTGSRATALAAGAITGAATAAAVGGLTGSLAPSLVVGGALLGGLQTLRGDRSSRVRDASGGATMLTGLFLPGASKIAGAVASGVGSTAEEPWKQALIGAAVGAAVGGALGATGLAGAGAFSSPIGAALISAAGGAIGPFLGPRFSQLFRNLANDCGTALAALTARKGIPLDETHANMVGAFPAQFVKEGVRGFINSDFNVSGLVVGGLMESIELAHLFWASKKPEESEAHAH
ncbi:MAG: hypothetical protein HY319_03185 [Armatimonadetes bacterium]|nr:hypothetical protein [Armatimonadota bacterium]